MTTAFGFHYQRLIIQVIENRVNAYDKPNVISKAKELCLRCECEFDKRVNFIEVPAIEEKLNTSIYSLDIRDLPITKPDVKLYNHSLYNSERRHTGEHWLVYDNINSHFHVVTNIRKLCGADFYCNACCRCF